ncbi:MAG: lytic transglycosylase domain-containing protein [Candidatus Polarisedimenticolia bacterium]
MVCLLPAASSQASSATQGWRVEFTTGSTLDVRSYSYDQDRLVLHLEDGGTFAVQASRVRRLHAIELPAAPLPAIPAAPAAPHSPPAIQAAPAEAPSAKGKDIDTLIREAAARHGLEADLLAAVIAVESGYKADAVSPKGAQGLMQLMPGTARELAVTDAFDPAQNIDAGARHLKKLIEQNGGAYWRALAAYNAGQGKVARYGGLPPYRETMSYVRRVLDRYGRPARSAPSR